jgi:hypothetical protein
MRTVWRLGVIAAWIVAAGGGPGHAQVELDRVVVRVGTRVITHSDLRQAMLLKLCDDVSAEAVVQRCLEDRWLILGEIERSAPLPPASESDLASRRAVWERRVGGAAAVPGLLSKAGMGESALQAWLRDDLRIQSYLDRQFEAVPPADRARATSEWINRLRQRARLK